MALVLVVGLLVTASTSWTAHQLDRNNERDLLRVQTQQAADVIGSAIVGIANPLQNALNIATATGGERAAFVHYMGGYTGPAGVFGAASLWRVGPAGVTLIAAAGSGFARSPASADGQRFVARALARRTFVVQGLFTASPQRVAYALAGAGPTRYVVYAERVIKNRRVPAENDAAFADLHFATYLGADTDPGKLSTTNVDPADLPLSGPTDRVTVPLGDAVVTLVVAPARHLGGQLSARMPWISLIVGILLTVAAALATRQLVRRRRAAEEDAGTIKGLYEELDGLYAQQRSVSLTLQHALLPRTNPIIPGVEFAAAYVAGDRGVEIGGDWYSVIALAGGRFGFVVGDVSGRGLDAAVIMARVRFTVRAYLLEGHPPQTALAMAAQDLDVVRDGHLVTALVGVGDPATRTVTVANAGHLHPLLLEGGQVRFEPVPGGPPLGVGHADYAATTIDMAPGSLLLAFTDGLVERRDEDIDEGLARLAGAIGEPDGPLEAWLATLLPTQLGPGPAVDDVAALALRWSAGGQDEALGTPAGAEPTVLG